MPPPLGCSLYFILVCVALWTGKILFAIESAVRRQLKEYGLREGTVEAWTRLFDRERIAMIGEYAFDYTDHSPPPFITIDAHYCRCVL